MEINHKIKVGVIGTGAIANIAHFPVLSSLPEVSLQAIYDIQYEKALEAKNRYGAVMACRTIEEFLNQDLDCAVLITPNNVRKEYLVPLMDRKLDILCEKPL